MHRGAPPHSRAKRVCVQPLSTSSYEPTHKQSVKLWISCSRRGHEKHTVRPAAEGGTRPPAGRRPAPPPARPPRAPVAPPRAPAGCPRARMPRCPHLPRAPPQLRAAAGPAGHLGCKCGSECSGACPHAAVSAPCGQPLDLRWVHHLVHPLIQSGCGRCPGHASNRLFDAQ